MIDVNDKEIDDVIEINEAYFDERRKRDELVKQRRKEALLKRQKQKRKLLIIAVAITAFIILLSVVITSIVSIKKKAKAEALENEKRNEELLRAEALKEEETKKEIKKWLGFNENIGKDNVLIHGVEVFSGYETKNRENAYYLQNENVQSEYAILVDAKDGSIVCQREGFTRINPASMTKILTVLVAAENLTEEDLDKEITITQSDVDYTYKYDLSCVGFEVDEVVTVRDLFYGTVLPSGADAAFALARYVSGDVDSFIDLMNEKIKELGLKNTHFTNCVGLFGEDHYTTCEEMAIILKAAIENDFVYEVMNEHIYLTSKTTQHPEGIEISNWFLRRIEDKDTGGEVICAKTGFVNESGCCAASYAVEDDGHPYICVTANSWSAWRTIYDHVDIYLNNTGEG